MPIERIRVSHDNQHLYSTGQDGVFGIFQIIDKDPVKKDKDFSQVNLSEEILIEKQEQDKFIADIEHLKNQIEIDRQKKEASVTQELDRKNKKIADLECEIADKNVENNGRYEKLLEARREMENNAKARIKQLVA